MKNIVVIYHRDCSDGFGAAWAAWRKFGKKADYFGIYPYPHAPLPKGLENKEIYFLDVAPAKDRVKKLLLKNKKIVLIDHHISRKELLKAFSESFFSLKHSGAVLAWDYFHRGKPAPRLLRHIEDIDLWKFKIPYTRELMHSLDTYKFNFSLWSKIAYDFEKPSRRKKYLAEGRAIIKYIDRVVSDLAGKAQEISFEGHKAFAVNSSALASELGNFIVRKKQVPLAVIWSYNNAGIYYQLRSSKKVDVSKLAEKFGGGGHKQAAAFLLKTDIKFPCPVGN